MEEILFVEHNSEDYWEAVKLRYKLLRQPLGLNYSEERLAKEADDLHLVYKRERQILACLVITLKSKDTVQVKQIAVENSYQRQGVGKKLMEFLHNHLIQKEVKQIELAARETAIDFYEKLGYVQEGERFIKITLPHVKMRRSLE
ncbi:MAG: GNAT family N-acetyltransferase [Cyanobacteriota bacterium]|nr:GNAT family N-acetyltransferase [Cyanobacteriota bacterium]